MTFTAESNSTHVSVFPFRTSIKNFKRACQSAQVIDSVKAVILASLRSKYKNTNIKDIKRPIFRTDTLGVKYFYGVLKNFYSQVRR